MLTNFFKKDFVQYTLIFILFMFLASIFLNMPLAEINNKMADSIDAYLISWVWSWQAYILPTQPLDLFQSNIFAPFSNTLAFTETMLGSFLLAWPILLFTNNIILTFNIVVLLTFAIAGLSMYLLIYYFTQNKWVSFIPALIYSFAPFKLLGAMGHLHLTGMWLPFIFLYLHKFFKQQTWKNVSLLTLFIYLVFLTGFHYFIFLPVVIIIFGLFKLKYDKFKFNKDNIKKILFSILIFTLLSFPLIIPYLQVKQDYDLQRSVEDIVYYAPTVIDYFISPFLYSSIYADSPHTEMIVGPGIFAILLLLLVIYIFFRYKEYAKNNKSLIFIYGTIGVIAFFLSLGFYIKLSPNSSLLVPGLYPIFNLLLPGFSGIRAVGRYSIFFLLSIAVLIGLGINVYQQKIKNSLLKIILFSLTIILLFVEWSFIPPPVFSTVKIADQDKELYTWVSKQPIDAIFMELPAGNKKYPLTNYDILYVYNSHYHFRKIVNGYSGYYSPDYLHLMRSINIVGPPKSLKILKKFQVNYLIYHFDYYKQPQEYKKKVINILNQSDNFIYQANFGNNYIYKIIYD